MKTLVKVSLLVLVLFAIVALAPRVTNAAAPALCSANPSTAVVGTKITIVCTGFDRDTWVNVYVVDPTSSTEWGHQDYQACMLNSQGESGEKGKTDETGTATFYWYTQSGRNEGNCDNGAYKGYANQIGTYTVVVQELGVGSIKYKGTVQVTLNGRTDTYSGATLLYTANVIVPGTFSLAGYGFAANEYVNVWFTRPPTCGVLGTILWSANSAFDPGIWGSRTGVFGPGTVKADSGGNIAATYRFQDLQGTPPCTGTWSVTVNALGSGVGNAGTFLVSGGTVANNASVFTVESAVPAITWNFRSVAVHAYGSGFPAGSHVNCWLTRPDGEAYPDFTTSALVDAGGNFGPVLVNSFTAIEPVQGEQQGQWAATCGTPDGKYSGVAWFWVVAPLDP